MYKVLTNRIRALIIAAGYIPGESYHVIRATGVTFRHALYVYVWP